MRIWSLHPSYLDRQGLTACWRESLLAQAVLAGRTKGYRNHPQLRRFQDHVEPLAAVGAYLAGIVDEATSRGYRYDATKILRRPAGWAVPGPAVPGPAVPGPAVPGPAGSGPAGSGPADSGPVLGRRAGGHVDDAVRWPGRIDGTDGRIDDEEHGGASEVACARIDVTTGQVAYEWDHLMAKLWLRSPERARRLSAVTQPDLHPLFRLVPGPVAEWEVRREPSPQE